MDPVAAVVLTIVGGVLGAALQAWATRNAAAAQIAAQRAIAYDAAIRERRQEKIGGFIAEAEACVSHYNTALALSMGMSPALDQAFEASLDRLARREMTIPIGIDDAQLRGSVERFLGVEQRERAKVVRELGFSGSDVFAKQQSALGDAVPRLTAVFMDLAAAADAYVFGDRPGKRRRRWTWVPWIHG